MAVFVGEVEFGKVAGAGTDAPYPERREEIEVGSGAVQVVGVKRGVSDVFLPVAKGGYHGLYIEMKAKDGKPEKEQKAWIAAVQEQGYYAAVCYGGYEASALVEAYMKGEVEKA
jgi:hypothetical protein